MFLKAYLQNDTIEGCDHNNTWLSEQCSVMANTHLRAICPLLCECEQQQAINLGFFGGPAWGCPQSCSVLMESVSEFWLAEGYFDDCEDTAADSFSVNGQMYHYFHGLFEFVKSQSSWERALSEDLIPNYGESIW